MPANTPVAQTAEEYLAAFPPDIQAIANALRTTLRETLPGVMELVYPTWKMLGYRIPIARKSAYLGFILPRADGVSLGFEHGAVMDDPHHLLKGTTRQVRMMFIADMATICTLAEPMRVLILEGARVAAMSKAARDMLTRL